MTDGNHGLSVRARALIGRLRRPRAAARSTDAVLARLDAQQVRLGELERELARVSPQVAALEERVEALRAGTEPPSRSVDADDVDVDVDVDVDADGASLASVLDQVRSEHARVRARISAATRYEERLRVVEDQVAALESDRAAPGATPVDPAQ